MPTLCDNVSYCSSPSVSTPLRPNTELTSETTDSSASSSQIPEVATPTTQQPSATIPEHHSVSQPDRIDEPATLVEPEPEKPKDSDRIVSSLNRIIYTPHGEWAWANGLPIVDSEVLLTLGGGSTSSASIMRGRIGDRLETYIRQKWPLSSRNQWRGLFSELALYKSENHLKPLQGDLVPYVIGLYVNPDNFNVAMSLPHLSFWIEASPQMPFVLKHQCIEALHRLHVHGILHGDIEARRFLIGADGKVTIIGFQESRSIIPNPRVGLRAARLEEFAMEMRKLKFKLDYDGAKVKEMERMERFMFRQTLRRFRQEGAMIPNDQWTTDTVPLEDLLEPPPDPAEWAVRWVNDEPYGRTFTVPGQTTESIRQAERQLSDAIQHLVDTWGVSPSQEPVAPVADIAETTSSDGSGTVLGKRKAEELPPAWRRLMKRHQVSPIAIPRHPSDCPSFPNPPSPTRLEPSFDNWGPPRYYPRQTTSVDCGSTELLPASTSTTTRRSPVKCRDFAARPHPERHGYYVPHPPTERRLSEMRILDIRQKNAEICLLEGLPYQHIEERLVAPIKGGPSQNKHFSLGRLRRSAAHRQQRAQQSEARSSGQKRKHGEMGEEAIDYSPRSKKRRRTPEPGLDMYDPYPDIDFVMSDEHLDLRDRHRILHSADIATRPTRSLPRRTSSKGRGIMRRCSPGPIDKVAMDKMELDDVEDFTEPYSADMCYTLLGERVPTWKEEQLMAARQRLLDEATKDLLGPSDEAHISSSLSTGKPAMRAGPDSAAERYLSNSRNSGPFSAEGRSLKSIPKQHRTSQSRGSHSTSSPSPPDMSIWL
ncbi:hypothetical protein C8Q75DRAFT_804253 [Abortiporus biennis]|nr:hypothetical protein C8Q75DRAFT_804253 [Abortiporus biennis]